MKNDLQCEKEKIIRIIEGIENLQEIKIIKYMIYGMKKIDLR